MMAPRIPETARLALLALALAACSGDRSTASLPAGPRLDSDHSGQQGNSGRRRNGDDGQNEHQNQNQNQNDDRNNNQNQQENEQEFTAQLSPLNSSVAGGGATGEAEFRIENGMLTVTVEVEGVAPSIVHMQHIHALHACPTMAADANHDGIVDFVEGLPSYGPVLVPLDDDISNATAQVYPTADGKGRIRYQASTPLATLQAALGGPLDLANRSVVIHGVVGPLPTTVTPANPAALPIACGPIVQGH
ncbi:MAG TPA: hypothetical protein VF832_09265 [Longimicrobiales bacterium]